MSSILIADDSRSIRQIASAALQHAGFTVIQASDGEQGFQQACGRKLDLILSDLNMPKMNGIELTRRIRSLPEHRETPILIVTTESQMGMKSDAKEAGANGWVVKPS